MMDRKHRQPGTRFCAPAGIMAATTFVVLSAFAVAGHADPACEHEPYELVWAGVYRDGGTIGAAIADSVGCLVEFCIDYRLGSAAPGEVYLGGRYPDAAEPEPLDATARQELADLIRKVLAVRYTPAEQAAIRDGEALADDDRDDHDVRHARVLLLALERVEERQP